MHDLEAQMGDVVYKRTDNGDACIKTFDSIEDANSLISLLGNSKFKAVEYVG